ncbi:glycerol-3-phosphate acyltransferase 2, mitochondrial isoform X5 [Hemicordylus capensis]|uniref:glycerol-3-phosphate acyltransferase 2, mitochondrial isoform X5 n=1 Tax=Hemicordylus capensis TaxID=884348 RepID=UPI002304A828|nr:glycerol-3-phosphate acyltransferase 2, mitochondrial isoform X5 [Hemicordylus capensis]
MHVHSGVVPTKSRAWHHLCRGHTSVPSTALQWNCFTQLPFLSAREIQGFNMHVGTSLHLGRKGGLGYGLLVQVKMRPMDRGLRLEVVVPFLGKYRPFVGRCCQRCTPKSWKSFFHKHLTSLGFCNVIKITEENTRVQEIVSQRVSQGKGDAPPVSRTQWMRKIQGILCQMQSSLSPFLLRFCHWVLLKLLNQMFLSVVLHKGKLEMVHKAAQLPDVPMVFLSTHKSQLDGLLLPLLLASQGLGLPRVTWEYKAYTVKHRALLTRLGGVFLPPGVEQTSDSEVGALSRAVLASYVQELLLSRRALLIFLEEPFSDVPLQRSASSREWLSLVLDVLHAGAVPDVTIVPVGLAYDVAPDANRREQKNRTEPLSLWTLLWTICRAACRGFGCVRVDFAQPFSLQEYIANNLFRHDRSGKPLEDILLPELLGKCCSVLDCEKVERRSPGPPSAVALTAEQQTLVDSLSLHALNAGVSCSPIMAVGIMSALLLHKHREGVFLSRLMQDFAGLTEEILLHNYDVGFSGQVRDVVLHALFLLRRCVSLHRLSLGDVLVAPKRTEAAVLELSHHSAALLPVFTQEAVGVCAINALLVELLPFLGSPEQLRDVVLVQEELHNKVLTLVQLLPRDVVLRQPCQSVYCYCQVVLDKLIQSGLLVAEEVPSDRLVCDTTQRRFTENPLWKVMDDFGDSDSDGGEEGSKRCFRVSQTEPCSSLFVFLGCLLGPLPKTLERAAAFLWGLEGPQPESQYLEKLHQFLLRKAKEDSSFECANRTLAAIATHIFRDLGVLREQPGPAEPILHLSEVFIARENQEKLEKFIQQFVYL